MPNLQAFRGHAFALLAFCLPLSIAASNVAGGLALLSAAAVWALDPASRRYRWTGVEIPWALLFAAAIVSSLLAEDPSRSLGKLRPEYLILFFVLAAQAHTPGDARRSLSLYAAAAGLAGLWGAVQAAVGVNYSPFHRDILIPPGMEHWPRWFLEALALQNGRAAGFFSHPLTYAEVLLLAWPLLLAGLLRGGKALLWLFGLALVSAGLLVSGSRTVWATVPLLLLVWAVVRRDKRVGVALLLALVGFGAALAGSPALRQRAASVAALGKDPSSQIRWSIWKGSVDEMRAHPVAGVGAGGLRVPTDVAPWGPRVWTETHNIFLQMAVERGLPGLAAFLFFLFALGRLFWRVPRGDLAGALFFAYVGLLSAGLTESWCSDSEVVMNLYFLAGTACALSEKKTLASFRA